MDEQVTKRLSSLEARVERLAVQVEDLSGRVDGLTGKASSARASPDARPAADDEFPDAAEALLLWVRRSSLLQRLSTLCFLLVIALVLRTITDNGMIDRRIGSVIGMSYAAALMGMGWLRYGRANPLAPVFTVCGTVLMFTIIGEAHARFGALPSVPAYILLMLTALGTAGISYVHRVPVPIVVGNLGMCITGAAIDYPTPFFPYLGILLLTANLLGYATARAHRYSWPRWVLLLITLFMIHLWGFKLGMTLLGDEQPPRALAPDLFLPFLALFSTHYMATAFLGIIRAPRGKLSRFDLVLPAINVAWAFPLARYVVSAMDGGATTLGIVGVVVGAGHLAAAYRLAIRDPQGAAGANAFVFAGGILLALALPAATHSPFLSLLLLAAVALGAAILSVTWQSGSVRLTSYLLQLYVSVALSVSLLEQGAVPSVWVRAPSAGLIACLGFIQYRWCRRRQPPEESVFFGRIDKRDFSAVIILLASLGCTFFTLRVVLHHILSLTLVPSEMNNVFYGSQSVVINLSAILLMFVAWAYRNTELRNTAILITVVGAVNVFLYDLIRTHGMPLVISVLSVGLATAVESVILGRWQQRTKPVGENGR
ncbi:MAG: hypothetical protein ACYC7J_05475 [Syntrophales bacterium]